MTIDLEAIGISQEELQERVVQKACDAILEGYTQHDEDGEAYHLEGNFERKINEYIQSEIERLFTEYAELHITPLIAEKVANFTIQKTNSWGEKQGEEFTLTEFLIDFAQKWMLEEVDSSGKTRSENRRYGSSFNESGTRISYAIHKHLDHYIKQAMKEVLDGAGQTLGEGINEAVRAQLDALTKKLKVQIKTD